MIHVQLSKLMQLKATLENALVNLDVALTAMPTTNLLADQNAAALVLLARTQHALASRMVLLLAHVIGLRRDAVMANDSSLGISEQWPQAKANLLEVRYCL